LASITTLPTGGIIIETLRYFDLLSPQQSGAPLTWRAESREERLCYVVAMSYSLSVTSLVDGDEEDRHYITNSTLLTARRQQRGGSAL
jgi:hypothetical protein